MKLVLDAEQCTGHGRCYTLVPELFEPDERGHCVLLVEQLDESQIEGAESAVGNCPEHALRVQD